MCSRLYSVRVQKLTYWIKNVLRNHSWCSAESQIFSTKWSQMNHMMSLINPEIRNVSLAFPTAFLPPPVPDREDESPLIQPSTLHWTQQDLQLWLIRCSHSFSLHTLTLHYLSARSTREAAQAFIWLHLTRQVKSNRKCLFALCLCLPHCGFVGSLCWIIFGCSSSLQSGENF